MFNNFKAAIRKWAGLPYADLGNLLTWSVSRVDIDNENLLVASANERGAPVAYVTAEPTLLVNAYAVSPEASEADKHKAGDCIDSQLEGVTEELGVGRFLIVLPRAILADDHTLVAEALCG